MFARDQCDEAAERMADNDGFGAELGVEGDRADLVGKGVARVACRPVAVAHAAQIHRGDIVAIGQKRGDEGKPESMCAIAMYEEEAGPFGIVGFALFAPAQVVDVGAVHIHLAALMGMGQRIAKPLRAMVDNILVRQGAAGGFFEVVRGSHLFVIICHNVTIPCAGGQK